MVIPPSGRPERETTAEREGWFTQARRLTDSCDEQRIEVDELRDVGALDRDEQVPDPASRP